MDIIDKIEEILNEVEISRQYRDKAKEYETKLVVTVNQKELDALSIVKLGDWDKELVNPKAGGKGYATLGEYPKGKIRTLIYGVDHNTKVSQNKAFKEMKALTPSVKFDID